MIRRSLDLILPPMDGELKEVRMADTSLDSFIEELESSKKTGCLKASSDHHKSRAAAILYNGRVMGCLYSCFKAEIQSTDPSLKLMLGDLAHNESIAWVYDLPEKVVLAISALFQGVPVARSDEYDARTYMDKVNDLLAKKKDTACVAFNLPASASTCLTFVHKGDYIGAFYVKDQVFKEEIGFVHDLLKEEEHARVEACILPPDIQEKEDFGMSLSHTKTLI
jgi:hypothetical protein